MFSDDVVGLYGGRQEYIDARRAYWNRWSLAKITEFMRRLRNGERPSPHALAEEFGHMLMALDDSELGYDE